MNCLFVHWFCLLKKSSVEQHELISHLIIILFYSIRFVSGDGTKVQEEGSLKVYDEKTAEEVVRGSYEYVSPEGRNIKVDYFADGTGFHAFSDDIPKSAGVSSPSQYGDFIQEHQAYHPVARSFPVADQKVNVVPVQAFQGNQVFNYPANNYNVQQ